MALGVSATHSWHDLEHVSHFSGPPKQLIFINTHSVLGIVTVIFCKNQLIFKPLNNLTSCVITLLLPYVTDEETKSLIGLPKTRHIQDLNLDPPAPGRLTVTPRPAVLKHCGLRTVL